MVVWIEEQLSGACTMETAAFDEFMELFTDSNLTAGSDSDGKLGQTVAEEP